jgi:hypothetical protein
VSISKRVSAIFEFGHRKVNQRPTTANADFSNAKTITSS